MISQSPPSLFGAYATIGSFGLSNGNVVGIVDGKVDMKNQYVQSRRADFDQFVTFVDANKDGKAQITEVLSGFETLKKASLSSMTQAFKNIDSNKDGKISRNEFQRAEIFDSLNTNKDESISLSEFTADSRNYFTELKTLITDKNTKNDGVLSFDEYFKPTAKQVEKAKLFSVLRPPNG